MSIFRICPGYDRLGRYSVAGRPPPRSPLQPQTQPPVDTPGALLFGIPMPGHKQEMSEEQRLFWIRHRPEMWPQSSRWWGKSAEHPADDNAQKDAQKDMDPLVFVPVDQPPLLKALPEHSPERRRFAIDRHRIPHLPRLAADQPVRHHGVVSKTWHTNEPPWNSTVPRNSL